MEIYLDTTVSGQWSRHNATQRLGHAKYIAWTYLPSLIFVLYGVLWQVIDGETKRLEKYRQLTDKNKNYTAAQTICLNYHSFWSPLAILQAARYKQWPVVFSSTGLVLSGIVLPNVQNYVLTWDVFCGQALAWGGQDCVQLAYADEYWSKVLISLLGLTLACALGLLWSLAQYPKDLFVEDPRGLEFIVALTAFWGDDDLETLRESLPERLDPRLCRLKIENFNSRRPQLVFVEQRQPSRGIERYLMKLPDVPFAAWVSDHLELALLPLWNVALLVILAGAIYVLVQMDTPEQDILQDYHLPWSPDIYLVVGVLVQSFYQVLEHRVRTVTVLYALQSRSRQPFSALQEDWDNTWPILDIFQAFRCGRIFLGLTLVGTVGTIGFTIMLGSLQVSASFYGSTTFHADMDGVISVLALNAYLFLISFSALTVYACGVYQKKKKKKKKNKPAKDGSWMGGADTVADLLAYALESPDLRADVCYERTYGQPSSVHTYFVTGSKKIERN